MAWAIPIGMKRRTPPTLSSFDPAVGLELEMVVAHATTGESLPVERYFEALKASFERDAASEGVAVAASVPRAAVKPVFLEDRCVALLTPDAEYGLDNGFNLLETSTRPFRRSEGGLLALTALVESGGRRVAHALAADGACVLNASQHPDCPRDAAWYDRVRVPRPIYRELVEYRGWRHWEGIDAKAQNGANVQVPVHDAVRALNVMLGLAAAHIALFTNSPIEAGRETGLKENRLTVWPRVFHGSRFPGDGMLAQMPPRPFVDLGDYFRWMFRPGTVTRSLPMGRRHDYKSAPTVLLEGEPSLAAFLSSSGWTGRRTDTGERVELKPDTTHFEHSQIAQFMDARLRYRLHELPPFERLMASWRRAGGLEALFEQYGVDIYIEGRCPGAGFADQVLVEEAGESVSRSIVMTPVAMQWGLLQRLDEAASLMRRHTWPELARLRERAIRCGMEDPAVATLCRQVLQIAADGLTAAEQPLLDYAVFVAETGRSGADRILDTWRSVAGQEPAARLAHVVSRHRALM